MGTGRRRQVISAAGIISGVTAFSRVLGLVRDAIVAAALGARMYNDVFQIAFAIPNMARRVLGEGALSAFIVPVITGVRREKGEKAAWWTTANSLNLFAAIGLALTLVGCLFSEQLFFLYGGARFRLGDPTALQKLGGSAELMGLGGTLTRIMFPFLLFLTLIALLMGILHSLNHFLAPALGSVMINITMIAAGLIFFHSEPVRFLHILAWAVLIGVVLRFLILFPPLLRRGFRWRPVFDPREAGFRELASKMPAAVYGTAIAQINIAVTLTLANFTGEGSVTYLVYSQRLIQLPLALFATALSTALLPQLSAVVVEGDRADLRRLMGFAIRAISLIFIPAAIGLMVLGRPIVGVIFERANWSETATRNTALALFYYALGLYAVGLHRIFVPLYYARKDMITPVKMGAITMVANAVMGVSLMIPMGFAGLALASALSSMVNATLLWLGLKRRFGEDLSAPMLGPFLKALLCGAIMGAVCWFGFRATERSLEPSGSFALLFLTLAWVAAGLAVYALTSRIAGLWDRSIIRNLLRR